MKHTPSSVLFGCGQPVIVVCLNPVPAAKNNEFKDKFWWPYTVLISIDVKSVVKNPVVLIRSTNRVLCLSQGYYSLYVYISPPFIRLLFDFILLHHYTIIFPLCDVTWKRMGSVLSFSFPSPRSHLAYSSRIQTYIQNYILYNCFVVLKTLYKLNDRFMTLSEIIRIMHVYLRCFWGKKPN